MQIPRKIPIIPKYLVLNSQTLIFTSWIVIAFVSLLVLLGLHKSVLTEITTILGILAVSLFLFFFIGLYKGMILESENPHVLNNIKENIDKHGVPDFSGVIAAASYIELSWLAIVIFAIGIFGYLLFFGLYFLILLLMALYLVFYLAYGMVFRHSQDTKGDVIKTLTYSVMYTILYTGVFFILVQVIKVCIK